MILSKPWIIVCQSSKLFVNLQSSIFTYLFAWPSLPLMPVSTNVVVDHATPGLSGIDIDYPTPGISGIHVDQIFLRKLIFFRRKCKFYYSTKVYICLRKCIFVYESAYLSTKVHICLRKFIFFRQFYYAQFQRIWVKFYRGAQK